MCQPFLRVPVSPRLRVMRFSPDPSPWPQTLILPFGPWTLDIGLEHFKRCRYEGQDEYGKGVVAYFPPSIVQRNVGKQDWGVPDTDKNKQECPDKPPFPEKDAHDKEANVYDTGYDVKAIREQGFGDVAAIKLPHRQEVEGSDEHPDPPGKSYGVQDNIRVYRKVPQNKPFK